MKYEILTGLIIFALVTTITPGPNNLMLMASGANFGFRRSMPHVFGVGIGLAVMVVLVGIGVMQLFDAYPITMQILKLCSVSYLLYMAYRIGATTISVQIKDKANKPMTFIEAALYQWLNPKSWTMALTAISVYSPSRSLSTVVLVAIIMGLIALPSISLWAALGGKLQYILKSQRTLRWFNISMALLLVLSLYPVLRG